MSESIVVYGKSTCSKCREAARLFRESDLDYETVDLFSTPLGERKLRELIEKMEIAPRDLLRTKEARYRDLGLGKRSLSDDHLISLMVNYPELIQRPIIERGDRAVLGRPIEKAREFLGL